MPAIQDSLSNSNKFLVVKNNQLCSLTRKQIGFWTRFKAMFGLGGLALKNVSKYINSNKHLFNYQLSSSEINSLNGRISRYRKNHCLFKVPFVKLLPLDLNGSSVAIVDYDETDSLNDLSLSSKKTNGLDTISLINLSKQIEKDKKCESNISLFIEECAVLGFQIQELEVSHKKKYKTNFKN